MIKNNKFKDTQIIGTNVISNAYSFDVQGNVNINGSLNLVVIGISKLGKS
jgi:hypothetical protein